MDYVFRRSYRGKIKAVIFDWAGTTIDYGSRAPAGVFVAVFQKFGVEITMAQAREPMGLPKRDHIQTILAMPDVAARWKDKYRRAHAAADIDEIYRQFIPMQLASLPDFGKLIPGVVELAKALRERGVKIGATTGYDTQMMEICVREAKRQGFEPDVSICASDVPAGRPAPWMALLAAQRLGVYPLEAIVKVGDTLPDIDEGLNAGMWSIGVAKTGNELGLSEPEAMALSASELSPRLDAIRQRLLKQGAHAVIDGVDELLPLLDAIEARLARGERP